MEMTNVCYYKCCGDKTVMPLCLLTSAVFVYLGVLQLIDNDFLVCWHIITYVNFLCYLVYTVYSFSFTYYFGKLGWNALLHMCWLKLVLVQFFVGEKYDDISLITWLNFEIK